MRVHQLTVEAFGPFADKVDIDLDDLSASGLFLIHGATGAGKTSLLDAIAFALYADVPGARSKKGLRSDHAPADRIPRVRVEFTAGARRLRVTRSPEYHRPKLRGTGTVAVPAKVALEEVRDGNWQVVSARHDEVAEVINDVLGMGLAQFAKVVVLPQGDFAAFLRASAEERRALLERLFDIRGYADVEEWLADRRRLSAQAAEVAVAKVAADLARIADVLADGSLLQSPAEDAQTPTPAVGSPGDGSLPQNPAEHAQTPTPAEGSLDAAALDARLTELLAGVDAEVSASLAAVDSADLAERAASTALAEATLRSDQRRRGARAQRLLADLAAQTPVHQGRQARLAAALRAQALRGHVAARRRAEAELHQARLQLDAHDRALSAHELPRKPVEVDTALTALRTRDESAHALEALRTRRATLRDRISQQSHAANEALRSARELGLLQAGLDAEAARHAEQLAQAEAQARDVDAARAAVDDITALLALHGQILSDESACAALKDRHREAQDDALTRRAAHLSLRERHVRGMAADLAAQLSAGDACPVCGSCQHPTPATQSDPVLREALEQAELDADAAVARVQQIEIELAALTARLTERRGGLGDHDEASLTQSAARAQLALTQAQEAQLRIARLRAGQVEHLAACEVHAAQVLEAKERAQALGAVVTELGAEDVRLADELRVQSTAHAGCPCWSEATDPTEGSLAHHEELGQLLEAARRAHRDVTRAADRALEVTAECDAAIAHADFPDLAAVEAALLDAPKLSDLEEAVRRHEDSLTAAHAILQDPDVQAALAVDADDLPALTAADAVARKQLSVATRLLAALESRRGLLSRLVPAVIASAHERDALVTKATAVRDLADTVNGLGPANPRRMRLTAYVLAARLEAVVAHANERLEELGSGRFLLEHTDERSGAARSGLGLRVLDQWTGRVRETASLSGGETFMASLALALGLADAVRAESGGHDLGTLFVDEGFGSLDDDSLEEVMTILDGLQDGGRSVGIVSHVADLRTRIPRQLLVTKTPEGSAVRLIGCSLESAAS